MISWVIIFNDIPPSPPIVLTYCLVPDSSPFWYIKPHSSIVGNRLSYIALLKSAPAAILFVEKRFFHHPTAVLILTYKYPVCWDSTFFIRIRWDLDHPMKSCDWQRPIKQNQPRIMLALGGRDFFSKCRCQVLGNLCDKAQDARHVRRSKARLPGICLTPLREKLVTPMML